MTALIENYLPIFAARTAPGGMARSARHKLKILNGFELRIGGKRVRVPMCAEKLLAFLAIRRGSLPRVRVAGELWPDKTAERAVANLRNALWRLGESGRQALDVTPTHLALAPAVAVDLHTTAAAARRLLETPTTPTGAELEALLRVDFQVELLPDWYDEDWLGPERENFRQLSMHALECLSGHLSAAGRYGLAATAALSSIHIDPLRESAHRALISVHFAEGNHAEAIAQFDRYRRILLQDLGMEPSPQLVRLMSSAFPDIPGSAAGASGRQQFMLRYPVRSQAERDG